MTEVACLPSRRFRRVKIRSLLVSRIVSIRGWVRVTTVEYKYSHFNRLSKGIGCKHEVIKIFRNKSHCNECSSWLRKGCINDSQSYRVTIHMTTFKIVQLIAGYFWIIQIFRFYITKRRFHETDLLTCPKQILLIKHIKTKSMSSTGNKNSMDCGMKVLSKSSQKATRRVHIHWATFIDQAKL